MKKNRSTITSMNEKRYSKKSLFSEYNLSRLRRIRSMIPKEGKLLEIGCWDGTTLKFYKEKFKGQAYGIDISETILKMSRPFYDQVKICDLNNDKIPFADNFFDVVVCGEVIEHIYNTDKLVLELRRVLKKGGTLVITTPNLASFINRGLLLLGFQPLGTDVSTIPNNYGNHLRKNSLVPAGHIRAFTHGALKDMMEANGFRIARTGGVSMTRHPLSILIENITTFFFPSLCSDIVFQCVKTAALPSRKSSSASL